MSNNIIIRYTKNNILTIPKVTDYPAKIFLPGCNTIPAKQWVVAKNFKNIIHKIEIGELIEDFSENTESTKLRKKIQTLKTNKGIKENELIKVNKEILTEKNKDKLDILQEQKKEIEAEIISNAKDIDELEIDYIGKKGNFERLTHKKKIDVINSTFNIHTLKEWLKDDEKAEVRNSILSRIEFIKKPSSKISKKGKGEL